MAADVEARLVSEARRRAPFEYARAFSNVASRMSPPFVAAHVAPMAIVAGVDGSWWQAANNNMTGTLKWRQLPTLPSAFVHLIDQPVRDRSGTTREMTIALEESVAAP
jgi:hypothetical protein